MCRRDKFFANNYNNNILLLIHVYFIPASRYTLNVLFIVLLFYVYHVAATTCTNKCFVSISKFFEKGNYTEVSMS